MRRFMKQFETGLSGEEAAERYLTGKGMRTEARRYRGADGEIDLIMLDGATVVFVEVKARPGRPPGSGLMAVTLTKRRRMSHAAMAFLMERGWLDRPTRFDVIEISAQGVLHVPGAFLCGD